MGPGAHSVHKLALRMDDRNDIFTCSLFLHKTKIFFNDSVYIQFICLFPSYMVFKTPTFSACGMCK